MRRPRASHLLGIVSLSLVVVACRPREAPLDMPPGGRSPTHVERSPYVVPEQAWAALKGSPGIVPSLGIIDGPRDKYGDVQLVPYEINGFRADGHGCVRSDTGPTSLEGFAWMCPIHPYFLVRGDNRVHVRGPGLELSLVRWDYLRSTERVELARLGEVRDAVFPLELAVPEWPWVRGRAIDDVPENLDGLRAEVEAFHAALAPGAPAERRLRLADDVRRTTAAFIQASELRGKPYEFLDELIAAAEGRPIGGRPDHSVALAEMPPASAVEVFAGGRLARLVTRDDRPPITFVSNLDDGQWGGPGGTIVACDLWYRQDEAGAWVLDAVMPVRSTSIQRHFDTTRLAEHDLGELFRASAF